MDKASLVRMQEAKSWLRLDAQRLDSISSALRVLHMHDLSSDLWNIAAHIRKAEATIDTSVKAMLPEDMRNGFDWDAFPDVVAVEGIGYREERHHERA